MKGIFICCILFFFMQPVLRAQQVSATVDKSKILIGEKIQLQLKGFFPDNQPVSWFTMDTIPHFEIMGKSKLDTQYYDQQLILTQTITLTSWDSGKWVIGPFKLPGGSTAAIPVQVSWSSPFDVNQPYHDIKDITEVRVKDPSNWYWYFLAIILLIVLFLLFFPGTKKEKPVSEIDPGAYQKAMQQLDQLEQENLFETDPREFFIRLINIFRWYLFAGKGIKSYSKTTDDLSIQLQKQDMQTEAFTRLVQVLRLSDLVKFARFRPHTTESSGALQTIRGAIQTIDRGHAL